jgi:hypothetical protein
VSAPDPKLEEPSGGEVIGELQHLRVIPPQLLMDAVAQPNPFLLQFLGKTRPRTQFDEPWINDLEASEQMTVGPQTVG